MVLKWWSAAAVVGIVGLWALLEWQPRAAGAGELPAPADAALRVEQPGTLAAHSDEPALVVSQAASRPPLAAVDAAVTPDPGPADGLAGLLDQASALLQAGDTSAAAGVLRQAVVAAGNATEAARAGWELARISEDPVERRFLVSRALSLRTVVGDEYEQAGLILHQLNAHPASSLIPVLQCVRYTVESGDSLWKLCNKHFPAEFGVSPEVGLLKIVNGLTGDTLKVGQELVVPLNPLRIVVDTREHGLAAFSGETAILAYRVGLGREARTPLGQFVVQVKQEEPSWFANGRVIPFGDPENVLGTRWMGFEDRPGATGYGIHGTDQPESIGKNESMGCVRMRNDEIEALFEVVPRGTLVDIL